MKLVDYISQGRGYQSSLARQIGVSPQLMYQWVWGIRPVPIERCLSIEHATKGLVTRSDLRPHDKHLIWPELGDTAEHQPESVARAED